MKTSLLAALATVGFAGTADAHCPHTRTVVGFYHHYLGRQPDHEGLCSWVAHLRRGEPAVAVEAHFLGGDEYFRRHGCCPRGFVRAMYRDVLGTTPCEHEVNYWAAQFQSCGCRTTVARRFLCQARHAPAPRDYGHGHRDHFEPAPVVVRPVRVVEPVLVAPYPERPAVSIRFSFRR
jgi:hypothetical protein